MLYITRGVPNKAVEKKKKEKRNRSHVNPISTNKPVSPSVLDKSVSPSVEEKQPQDKALTPLKPLPSPCLSSTPRRLLNFELELKDTLLSVVVSYYK